MLHCLLPMIIICVIELWVTLSLSGRDNSIWYFHIGPCVLSVGSQTMHFTDVQHKRRMLYDLASHTAKRCWDRYSNSIYDSLTHYHYDISTFNFTELNLSSGRLKLMSSHSLVVIWTLISNRSVIAYRISLIYRSSDKRNNIKLTNYRYKAFLNVLAGRVNFCINLDCATFICYWC